jgi:hypothetical protein
MENTRKSDVIAFSVTSKMYLFNYLDKLNNGSYLSVNEQKNMVLDMLKALEIAENLTEQNEQNIAKINEIQTILKKVDTVENIIQSTMYKITTAWK